MTFMDDIRDRAASALGVRDDLGVGVPVKICTRTWSGATPGEGTATEVLAQILPTPFVVDYSMRANVPEAGNIKQGDLVLKSIAQKNYPNLSDIDCTSTQKKIQKFYEVDGKLYRVIHVRKRVATWEVHVRRLTDQTRY